MYMKMNKIGFFSYRFKINLIIIIIIMFSKYTDKRTEFKCSDFHLCGRYENKVREMLNI